MKTLELNQMENLNGGYDACNANIAAVGFTIAAVVVAAATGPFGWGAALACFSSGFAGANLIASGNCF